MKWLGPIAWNRFCGPDRIDRKGRGRIGRLKGNLAHGLRRRPVDTADRRVPG